MVPSAATRPPVHDDNSVAQTLRRVQLVRRDQHSVPVRAPLLEHVFQLTRALRINADQWLVETVEPGPVDEGAGAGQFLFQPFAQTGRQVTALLPQIQAP